MTDHDRETYRAADWRVSDRQWLWIRVSQWVLIAGLVAFAGWVWWAYV